MLFDDLFNLLPIDIQYQLKTNLQSRNFHSEGVTYNHIKMVSALLPDDDINLQFCALFHDIGKPISTRINEKKDAIKVQAIGHENYCEQYINEYKHLYSNYNVNWELVIEVCKYHMIMHKFINNELRECKRKVIMELKYFDQLKIFALADNEGRIVGEGSPYLVCTVGIPGSGKSFWANDFSSRSNYKIVCPDSIRSELSNGNPSDQTHNKKVWELSYHRLKEMLEKKEDVIFDSTLCNLSTLKSLVTISKEKNAIILFKIFDVPVEICKQRIKKDIDNNIIRSNVPDEIVENMNKNFPNVIKYIKDNNYLIINS